MNKVAAFDLDGTLSQSEYFLMPAYREVLAEMGMPLLSDETLKNLIGGSMDDNHKIVMPNHPREDFLDYCARVHRVCENYIPTCGKIYPHIDESLRELHNRGYLIALCSNGEEAYINTVLGALGLTEHFDFIQHCVFGCDKPQLLKRIVDRFAPARVVMVGDRHFDKEAAVANKVPFIGCLYGIYPDEVADADIAITDAAQLPAAVEKLIG